MTSQGKFHYMFLSNLTSFYSLIGKQIYENYKPKKFNRGYVITFCSINLRSQKTYVFIDKNPK